MELFAHRRRRLLEGLEGVAVIGATPVATRNRDIEHPYRQDSDLYYFTGLEEPRAALVLTSVHEEHRAVLFVQDRDADRELWDGARVGVEAARERFDVDAAFPIAELSRRLPDYLIGAATVHYELGHRPKLDALVIDAIARTRARARSPQVRPKRIVHPEETWHEMRLRKDEAELAALRRAASITCEAHRAAMAAARPGQHEYELEAVLGEVFRRRGSPRVAYETIVASGANATVLHYVANRRRMEEGDLVLIDAGCEWDCYAGDITRTFPVSGRFSEPQRRLYEVVLAAQVAAIEACRPGATVDEVHQVALQELVAGMLELGLLTGRAEAIIADESYKRYFMHRTSHWLGLDVHDVGAYYVDGASRALEPGMVVTIEPGLYVSATDDQAPADYRGIGIRIEDDIVITADGYENLTAAVPKSAEEVEQACRG
ncbi:MAG: aminopeptidase P N-terminal domain-containing protein [Deltaproteobacteria bacterium]|jgi:Xaa-Pro aminopeptidase|nr:aminopeptidase P N-terminal domain-containing protein [Deltaproteobacteria bacterium]MBW2535001.1 aminopeptidase P N-terminal domain-containing protein [Deltaproteobacteria bacterium]